MIILTEKDIDRQIIYRDFIQHYRIAEDSPRTIQRQQFTENDLPTTI